MVLRALLPESLAALQLLGHASALTAARRALMLLDRPVALTNALRAAVGRQALLMLVRAAALRAQLLRG